MSDDAADQGVAGVGLLIAGYTDEKGADGALDALKQAKDAGAFAYDDAAVIRRDADGKVHIKETGDMSAGKGAGIGALIGGVFGLLGGPAGVALAAGAGAAIGGIAAHSDAGFNNETLERIGGGAARRHLGVRGHHQQVFRRIGAGSGHRRRHPDPGPRHRR